MWETAFPWWIPAFSEFIFPYCANLMAHSTAIILLGLLTARALRGRGAAVLASPVASITASFLGIKGLTVPAPRLDDAWHVFAQTDVRDAKGVRNASPAGISFQAGDSFLGEKRLSGPGNDRGRNMASATAAFSEHFFPRLGVAATLLWTALFLFLAGRLAVCFLFIRRIRNSADDAPPHIIRDCWRLSRILDIEPPVILQSQAVKSPFLTGMLHPAIMIPLCMADGEPANREVILHELAHLARRDCIWNLLARVSIAVLPLQPLAWILARRMEDANDDICDDYVVYNGANPRDYARTLYTIAERFHPSAPELAMGVGIAAFKSSLGKRVARILDTSRKYTIHPEFRTTARLTLLCALLAVLAGFTGLRNPRFESGAKASMSRFKLRVVSLLDSVSPVSPENDSLSVKPLNKLDISGHGASVLKKEAVPVSLLTGAAVETSGFEQGNRGDFSEPEPDGSAHETAMRTEPAEYVLQAATQNPANAVNQDDSPAATEPAIVDTQRRENDRASSETVHQTAALPQAEKTPVFPPPAPPARDQGFLSQLSSLANCLKISDRMVETGKYGNAEEALKAALGFEPNNPDVLNRLGRVYLLERNYEKAISILRTAVARRSNFADAYYNLGDVYMAQGDLNSAMKNYKTAIQINPAYSRRIRSFY